MTVLPVKTGVSSDEGEIRMTDILGELRAIVGAANVLTGDAAAAQSLMWNTHQHCHAAALVRPADTAEVSAVLKLCNGRRQSIVPYGGLTGLVDGATTTRDNIALTLSRMNTIEETDPTAQTMIAQAGVTMRQAQEAADDEGLFFPIDIGARDACAVGGFVSTNAGGTKVIRYGMTRDAVLGLEAVLADGTVISSMNRYIKNNSGFDLKQLFIGSEGALGIITRVVFRLSVKPQTHHVSLIACQDYAAVIKALHRAQQQLGSALCGFELMWDSFYKKATQPLGPHKSPFEADYPMYAIVESMGISPASDEQQFMQLLESLLEDELIQDAIIAKSDAESAAIWAIRGEVEWLVNDASNFDVSLRTSDVESYIEDINQAIRADYPDALIATFGHLGDNNLHVSILSNSDAEGASEQIEKRVYECLVPYQGAISAEHGIGFERKPYLHLSRSDEELELMRTLKATLDPHNILNPGKVVSLDDK